MGGKGGGVTPDPPRRRQPPDADPCKVLRIETNLMSPQADQMKSVRQGDTLPVRLQHDQGRAYAAVLNASGKPIGTIGSEEAITLIECIDKGHVYSADILSMDGGTCRVLVHLEKR